MQCEVCAPWRGMDQRECWLGRLTLAAVVLRFAAYRDLEYVEKLKFAIAEMKENAGADTSLAVQSFKEHKVQAVPPNPMPTPRPYPTAT